MKIVSKIEPTISRKEYMLKRYYERRDYAYKKLGGECIVCGSKEELNLDHLDPKLKSFNISQLWSISQERFDAELDKCQILCKTCHKAKNLMDLNIKAAVRTHGTLSSYRYCKCGLCKKAYSEYWKSYKPKKRRPAGPRKVKGGLSGQR